MSFDVREGEFFGLLGPNGAGKTTLFRVLSTLTLPDGGVARIGGHDVVRNASAVRRLLAPVVADERSLFWRLSAHENLRLFATLDGIDATERDHRSREALEVVGLAASTAMVGTFSSGMRQRLLLARALLRRPRVLLLDEPTRSLDPVMARRFRRFLRDELAPAVQCTVLLATHQAEEAFELCDRVAVLDRGHLLAAGRASELGREAAEDRHHLWTTAPDHHELRALESQRLIADVAIGDTEADGWSRMTLRVPGGNEGAASLLRRLAMAQVPVARLERIEPTLADILERIVAARGVGS